MKRITLFLNFLFLFAIAVNATPAQRGVKRMLTLSNGEQFKAELVGDEFLSYWVTEDGKAYQFDSNIQAYQTIDLEAAYAAADKMRAKRDKEGVSMRAKMRKVKIGGSHIDFTGKQRCLVILVNYQDVTFSTSAARMNTMINGPLTGVIQKRLYPGTVKQYFLDQSNNKFELDFDVKGPYTISQNQAYYGGDQSNYKDVNVRQMITEGVRAAINDGVDLSIYDWDKDGEAEMVYVIYAGEGQAAGGADDTVWPHKSSLGSQAVTSNGVTVNNYACSSELQKNWAGSGTQTAGIATICHEFSHCLGLPDFYDTRYTGNFGLSSWDLMASGTYNKNGYYPPNYSAYEKWYIGWIEPKELKTPTTVTNMKPNGIDSNGSNCEAYIIYNEENKNEYYILENRQQQFSNVWDQGLIGSGLMIQHYDFDPKLWEYNALNSTIADGFLKNDHERGTIFRANNSSDERALPTDLYPSNGNTELTDSSSPAAILYQGTKGKMGKPITEITQNADGTISFKFMGGSGTDGIESVDATADAASHAIYSLDGIFMGTDITKLPHGVYIVNGKKFVK